jgi:hypothetical protein
VEILTKLKSRIYTEPVKEFINCTVYIPDLKNVDPNKKYCMENPVDLVEITTNEENPKYYILPIVKNKYSLRVGFEISANDCCEWKLGIIELSELFNSKSKWLKFNLSNIIPLWKCAISPYTSIVIIEEYTKPTRSYINKIPKNAIRTE